MYRFKENLIPSLVLHMRGWFLLSLRLEHEGCVGDSVLLVFRTPY